MKHLIIGKGEVGMSLYNILSIYYSTLVIDEKWKTKLKDVDIIHICFPYDEKFIGEVTKYRLKFNPKYVIIHSTVSVGTSRILKAIHSPIIGIHPFLKESILTFTKFLSGEGASEVADIFRRVGMKVYLFKDQETTELMKLIDTTFYGICVEYTKEIKKLCEENGVPFEAWTIYNQNYNDGYEKLGLKLYVRPNLVPIMKTIGGHCVLPNCELFNSKFSKFLKDLNETTPINKPKQTKSK